MWALVIADGPPRRRNERRSRNEPGAPDSGGLHDAVDRALLGALGRTLVRALRARRGVDDVDALPLRNGAARTCRLAGSAVDAFGCDRHGHRRLLLLAKEREAIAAGAVHARNQ